MFVDYLLAAKLMRKMLLVFSGAALVPIIYLILFATLNPKGLGGEFSVAGVAVWLCHPIAFAALIGMCSLWTYGWDGSRILKVTYARLSVVVFVAYLIGTIVVARPFSSLGLWLFYGGWSGLFIFAAITMPLLSLAILLWYSRHFIFGAANNSLKSDAAKPRTLG